MQLVAQPLDDGTADEDRAFQRVLHLPVQPDGNGRDKTVLAFNGLLAGIHQQKTARSVCILRVSGLEAALAEQRCLLVARDPGNGDLHALNVAGAVDLRRAAHLRQHRRRNVQLPQEAFVPAELVDIIEHRARGVRIVGDVDAALGQLPDEPGIDRAEQQLAALCFFARAVHIVQQPFDLRPRKIGVEHKSSRFFDIILQPARGQLVTDGRGAAALPDDGVVDGAARRLIPDDGRLTLVRNADGCNVVYINTGLRDDLHHDTVDAGVDLHWIVLDPAGGGIVLRKFLLRDGDDVLILVKQDRAAAGRALIEGKQITAHGRSSRFT